MTDLDATLVADGPVRLDDLTWRSPVLAIEPRVIPAFAGPAPDEQALWRRVAHEAEEAQQRLAWEGHVAQRLGRMRTSGIVSLVLGLAMLGVFALGQITGELDGYVVQGAEPETEIRGGRVVEVQDETTPFEIAASVLLVASSIGAAACFASYRRARDPNAGSAFLPAAGILVVSCCAVGLVPAGLGLFMVLSKPLFRWPDTSLSRLDRTVLGAVAQRKEVVAELRALATDPQGRYEAELHRQRELHAAARQEHDHQHAAAPRFDLVPPMAEPDLLCIGGSPAERAEVIHHLVGSLRHAGPVWVFDLSANATLDKARRWAEEGGDDLGVLDATDDRSLHWHLDGLLGQHNGRRSLMVDVLIDAFAPTEGEATGASRRDIADTLQRVAEVLDACDTPLSLEALHESIQVLLAGARRSGGSGPTTESVDDFGIAPAAPTARCVLGLDVVEALRTEFTDDERREYLREWTDIRRKLRALRAPRGTETEPHRPWRAGARVNMAFVGGTLAVDDLQLRRTLLVGICRNLLRADRGRTVRSVVVAGADHLDHDVAVDLSNLAEASGATLVTVFSELTPTARQLARGRRSLAVFGGLGSEAAEELSTMLGMDWTERAQSYQATWSDAESESRAETSGRSWSTTTSDGRTKTWGSSSGEHGSSSNRSTARTSSTGTTDGGSSSETYTSGTTHTDGGSETTVREYEQVARGAEITRLAPFTALLRHGSSVRFVDFNGAVRIDPPIAATAVHLVPALRTRRDSQQP